MGRLTQHGDDLVISTELVDVRDNRRLWGEQYNRKLSDILAVQTEIAQQISKNLRLRLSGEDRKLLARNYTEDTDAYRRYSLGMYSMRENTKEAMEKAIEYFEAALKYDPSYTLAYTGLYRAYYGLGQMAYWLPKDSRQKMEWAALKAVELDDSSVEAHLQLATVRKVNWEWASAEKEYKRALELDPNSVRPNFSYAAFLMDVGRPDEAMVYARRAEELDHDHKGPAVVAMVYLYDGDYDKAIELYLKRPNRGLFELAEAYTAKGMYKEALEQVQKSLPDDHSPEPWSGYPRLASAYALAGRRDEALKILNEQRRAARQRYISPFNFAIIYTGLGDKDRAFEYLNKACDDHVLNLSHFMYGPMFLSLHSDPRYKLLLNRMNLVA
jgi:tetratricopeptide (TPR) repeat protein